MDRKLQRHHLDQTQCCRLQSDLKEQELAVTLDEMKGSGVKDVFQCNTAPDCRGGAHWVLSYSPTIFCCLVFAIMLGSHSGFVFSLRWSRHAVSPTSGLMPRRQSPKRVHFARVCKSTYLQGAKGKEIGSLLRSKAQPSSVILCRMDLGLQKFMSLSFSANSLLALACTTEYSSLQVPNHDLVN